ncbi:hypothetical protein [Rhodococcus sp. 14C212]|uniref:hypothetical protein n=1 Tax=Rhodococcus sp. 14C212 TaxID=2711209 RepID=UPI0013EC597E|nr:hypothetical protein [Rhodococcus sp. 14C212]
MGVAYPYRDRTSSLNATQAKPNADGTYTFVISGHDPGVYNWLDPNGHDSGMIAVRWQSLTGRPAVDEALRSSSVVRLGALSASLPAGTAVVDAGERRAQQTQRAADFDRRLTQ